MPRCRPTADMAPNPKGDDEKKNEEVSRISKAPNLTENSRHSSIGLQLCVHTRDEGVFLRSTRLCATRSFSSRFVPQNQKISSKGHFVGRELVN